MDHTELKSRRRSTRLSELKKRKAKGEDISDQRAYVRLGKGATNILTGSTDLSEWDEEELRRGRRRGPKGKFSGKDPLIIPKAVHDELVRRTIQDAKFLFQESLPSAVKLLMGVIEDDDALDRDRIKAAELIINRVMGKVPDVVDIRSGADAPLWMQALQSSVITLPEESYRELKRGADEDEDEYDDDDN